jgi:hypothetical protein
MCFYFSREKWLSILHHVCDVHSWSGSQLFIKCDHEPEAATDPPKAYLQPASAAFQALKEVVTDQRLLKALNQLTKFCHTGQLEVQHSHLTKYCPKRQYFPYSGMFLGCPVAL